MPWSLLTEYLGPPVRPYFPCPEIRCSECPMAIRTLCAEFDGELASVICRNATVGKNRQFTFKHFGACQGVDRLMMTAE